MEKLLSSGRSYRFLELFIPSLFLFQNTMNAAIPRMAMSTISVISIGNMILKSEVELLPAS